jgi:hypothetical protein
MTDANFASLSPRLLARKGGAKPAMRSQLGTLNAAANFAAADLEDLGWNDLGDDAEAAEHAPSAMQSAEVIAIGTGWNRANASASGPETAVTATPVAGKAARSRASGTKLDRSAFTLRLDPDRHLKLRLACTVRQCSAQRLVTDALDALLADMPDILKLAAQVGRT